MDILQTSRNNGQSKSGVALERRPERPAIDHQVVNDLFITLGPDSYQSLLNTFAEDFIEVQARLIAAMTALDVEELRKQLHAIRNISLPVGAVELMRLVGAIETHEDEEVLRATVRSLQNIAREFRRFQMAAFALLQ